MSTLTELAVKVLAVTAVTLIAVAAARRQSAALRHWMLNVGIVCALLIPLLTVVAPAWHLPVVSRSAAPAREAAPVVSGDAVGTPSLAPSAPAFTAAPVATAARWSVAQWLAALWIAGVVAGAALIAIGLLRLSWLAARARLVDAGQWRTVADDVAAAYALDRHVAILQSQHPSLLVAWGRWRPRVILPRGADGWPLERVRIVLAHELAHIRRGDWAAQLAAELLRVMHWFNPVVWVACRHLRDASEQACDDLVLERGIEGSAYATELLEVARELIAKPPMWTVAPAMARRSTLERRVTAMLDPDLNRTPLARSRRALTVAGLTALALAIAGFTLSAQTFVTYGGTVVDQTGLPVKNVTLTLENTVSGQKYEVKSSAVGLFELVGVAPGQYTMHTTSPGFKDVNSTIIVDGKNKNVHKDVQLQVGMLEETITVTSRKGEAPVDARPVQRAGDALRPANVPVTPYVGDGCVAQGSGGVIKQPTKVADKRPIYPSLLSANGTAGVVILRAIIATDGTVREATPLRSIDPDLDAAAIEAVKQWRYTPTLLNCVPIEVSMTVTVNFESKP